jgi:hypothetical protein
VTARTAMPRWPLFLIAAPAAVAVWSGWVGLGEMAGFGVIHPLPGIIGGFSLNTAITLPIGVEAYGAYALGAWLAPGGVPETARKFARRSAIGALALGMAGQVIYHLLAAADATRAPWPVVVLVSCMPVVTLGFGAALTHLLRAPGPASGSAGVTAPGVYPPAALALNGQVHLGSAPAPALESAPGPHPAGAPGSGSRAHSGRTRNGTRQRTQGATDTDAEVHFAADLAAGELPPVRRIQRELHVGQERARALRKHLESLVTSSIKEE